MLPVRFSDSYLAKMRRGSAAEQDVHDQEWRVANQAVQGVKAVPDDGVDVGLAHGAGLAVGTDTS